VSVTRQRARGFVRIRHFGFLANRFRVSRLAFARQLLASSNSTERRVRAHDVPESSSLWHCPRVRRVDDRDSETHCCGTISMHILIFLMCPSPTTRRGCAPAPHCIRVLTPGPRPRALPSANIPAALGTTAHCPDPLFRFLPIDLLHPKPPFKSHTAPRPPQTSAASS
jgi:hypothetical protein